MPGHLIRRAQQTAVAIFVDCTKGCRLTPVQYAAMTVAESYPGIDQRTLAGMVAFDPATIGDVVRRLEQRGLLHRQNGSDRRTMRVSLTRAGEKILRKMDKLVLKSQVEILKPLSDGEQIILMFLLSKLVNLSNKITPAPLTGGLSAETRRTMRAFLRATFTLAKLDAYKDMLPTPGKTTKRAKTH
jgi:DNA-binding MarR family transcriptional regulator